MKITTKVEYLKKGESYDKREQAEIELLNFTKMNQESYITIRLPSGDSIYIPDTDFLRLAEFLVKKGRS